MNQITLIIAAIVVIGIVAVIVIFFDSIKKLFMMPINFVKNIFVGGIIGGIGGGFSKIGKIF